MDWFVIYLIICSLPWIFLLFTTFFEKRKYYFIRYKAVKSQCEKVEQITIIKAKNKIKAQYLFYKNFPYYEIIKIEEIKE